MSLKNVYEKLETIASYSGKKDKDNLISKYIQEDKLFKKTVFYALHPFKRYNTTQVNYNESANPQEIVKIFKMLEYLSQKRGANDKEINYLSYLSSFDQETVEVVRRIVNKDLRCGASLKTFRKFIPELPEYSVMLGERDIDKFFEKCNNDLSQMRLSLKLDGVRCTTSNNIYLSRNGKEFLNFFIFDNEINKLKEKLAELYPEKFRKTPISLDGEVISNSSDHEFQDLMKDVRRIENVDTSKFTFVVFDIVLEDTIFEDRFQMLKNAFENSPKFEKISFLDHPLCSNIVDSKDQLIEYANYVIDSGYEGLMIKNINSYYERKKSRNWLKIKQMQTIDCQVTGWEYGEGKNSDVVGALNCMLEDGTTFNVSGMSDGDRVNFMYDTPSVIEVEFQDYTKDGIPRFPRFKRRRDDKDEID